jgi:RimJ/RimL family protein N-acetyltransferase
VVNIPTLSTDRLVLRAFHETDAPAIAALHGDPEVMRFLSPTGEPKPGLRDAWEYMALHMGHWLLKGYGKWALVDRASGELVGRVGFYHAPYDWPGLELGWTVARRLWGQGYAVESARLARDWAFETLNADEIVSAIHPDNAASVRVAERIGERRMREMSLSGRPHLIYGITRDEWHAQARRT